MTFENNTRKIIVRQATKFFYDQGYEETPVSQIAKVCNISPGLVTYYFATKMDLASEIHTKYLINKKKIVEKKMKIIFGEYDLQYATAIELRLSMKTAFEDPKFFRFRKALIVNNFENEIIKSRSFYELHDKTYNLDINRNIDELSLLAYSSRGVDIALFTTYFNGNINCDFDDFIDYKVTVPFRFMKIPEDRIEEIVFKSKELMKKMDFKIKPYFKIE